MINTIATIIKNAPTDITIIAQTGKESSSLFSGFGFDVEVGSGSGCGFGLTPFLINSIKLSNNIFATFGLSSGTLCPAFLTVINFKHNHMFVPFQQLDHLLSIFSIFLLLYNLIHVKSLKYQ